MEKSTILTKLLWIHYFFYKKTLEIIGINLKFDFSIYVYFHCLKVIKLFCQDSLFYKVIYKFIDGKVNDDVMVQLHPCTLHFFWEQTFTLIGSQERMAIALATKLLEPESESLQVFCFRSKNGDPCGLHIESMEIPNFDLPLFLKCGWLLRTVGDTARQRNVNEISFPRSICCCKSNHDY